MDPQEELWQEGPKHPILRDGEVHIWRAYLDERLQLHSRLLELLSCDELERANKFYFKKDRKRWMIARCVLRTILSRYINLPPKQIRFSYNHYGKPSVSQESLDGVVYFNLAHSRAIALYAITRDREIGVDVEYMSESCVDLELAQRFFSPPEVSMLGRLPPNSRTDAFFNCWTRKEAFVKAHGEGLSYPLDRFSVSVVRDQPDLLLHTHDNSADLSTWRVVALSPGDEYRAALAVNGDVKNLQCWQWG